MAPRYSEARDVGLTAGATDLYVRGRDAGFSAHSRTNLWQLYEILNSFFAVREKAVQDDGVGRR